MTSSGVVLHTPDQVELIKSTVAKGASNDELRLFLYRANELGLDPLKPGQIHFVKYGNSPGTIVIGIDGFRAKAAETGKHVGTKRGVLRDDKGRCVGAWAEVFRSDWLHPAREEVSLAEYTTGKGPWAKMPETMIKKVAECAALRMAFPEKLGGVYGDEEMHQAQAREETPKNVRPGEEETPKNVRPGEEVEMIGPAKIAPPIKATSPAATDEKDPNAWKERRAVELGWGDRKDQAFHVRRILDVCQAFGAPEGWVADRLREMNKKTLWALTPDEARIVFDDINRAGESGAFRKPDAPEFAPPPPGDDIPF